MRCRLLALLAALFLAPAAFAALSPEAFTQEYISLARAALPKFKFKVVKPLEVLVTSESGEDSRSYLSNAYAQYQSDPDARQEILQRHVASLAESVSDSEPLDPKNIIPIIKDREWIAETDAAARNLPGAKPSQRVTEDLNEILVIVYAEDTPTNIRYFDVETLKKAGVDRSKLRALAVENLARLLPDVQLQQGDLFTMITAGGNFEVSLLLFDDLWKSGDIKVDGEFVVAVPSRDVLLVTGSRNTAGVAKLREIAREIVAEGTYTLTDELFVYRDGRFVRYQ